MALKGQLSIKSEKQAKFVANQIARDFNNRGFASVGKIQTVLNDLKQETDLKTLKQLDESKIEQLIEKYREEVENGDLTRTTTATYISALNVVIDYTNHLTDKNLEYVSATEHDLSKVIDYSDKSISPEQHQSFQNYLQDKFKDTQDNRYERLELATELQKQFGLRARESFGLSKETIEKGLETGKLSLGREDWTKNAREREININTKEQQETLIKAQNLMSEHNLKSLAGKENNIADIKSFKNFAYKEATNQGFSFHAERHAWAQGKYSAMWRERTGAEIQSPIKYYSEQLERAGWDGSGKFYDAVQDFDITPFREYVQEQIQEQDQSKLLEMPDILEIDREIRQEISEELGHSRLDITNTYLGHP